jgi:hypothetical protein
MNEAKVIGEIQKNKREKIIVSANEFKGYKYVDLRVHYNDGESAEYKPSKKGIAIKPELVEDIIKMIQEAAKEITDSEDSNKE